MIRRATLIATLFAVPALLVPAAVSAAERPCELEPRSKCFGIDSVEASLSTVQAGAHPDLTFSFEMKQDPESEANQFGLEDGFATPRDIRFELPPGLIGDPNVLGVPQQCTVAELAKGVTAECPNGSQVGRSKIFAYGLNATYTEPVYMMQPPGGDIVARLGTVAGVYPTFIDLRVRSESDYGIVAEISDASVAARLIRVETTTWGVPADPSHDTERCQPAEILFTGQVFCEPRPPGSLALPFLTNPTRCGVPLEMRVSASSWVEPDRFDTKSASFPQITGCDRLPFGPNLTVQPTSKRAASPTGAEVTIRLPASDGVEVLEPSQMREIAVELPEGFAFNPAAGDGLATCSPAQVHYEERVASECPDAAKLATTEFEIPVLERNLKGAVYLREPEPGHPFRIWITADDLGLHVKLPGELEVDKQTGQITSVTTEVPQAPVREAKLLFKSGFRAPLITPSACGTYETSYEFVPWAGGPPVKSSTPMTISEGCDTGGFAPKLSAGTVDPTAGQHSPFVFTLTRRDGEQNPASLDIALPPGLAATFAGIPRCEGAAAASGRCPAASRIGHVIAAVGAGPAPLWVPQAGKRPTAVYLAAPYKRGPLSIVAVVPRQAGPFDFGDEVIRSAIRVNPITAQATIRSDSLPQRIEGIPIPYRTIHVAVDREGFTLNPTGCQEKQVIAGVRSAQGGFAAPASPFAAVNCASLGFKPRLGLRLRGGVKRGAHPSLRAVFAPRSGDANASRIQVKLPTSAFLDQAHIRTICTRVQFAAGQGHGSQCPPGAVYGHVRAYTPLISEPLEGPVFLRSSDHNLPDMVMALSGPPSLPIQIEAAGRIDSVRGGIRSTFAGIPDAPLSRVVLDMQGGRKGLIVNSRHLCHKPGRNRANANLRGHNGRIAKSRPRVVALTCAKRRKARRARGKRSAGHVSRAGRAR